MEFIGIIGSRRRNSPKDKQKVYEVYKALYKEGDWIVSGGCPKGGDAFAEDIAKDQGVPIIIFYPNWGKYGRGAGFVRNTFIAEKSTLLIACVAKDRKGGTEDTIKKFLKNNNKDCLFIVED